MNDTTNDSDFGPLIYSYTRAQAITDGVLIDVSETAREAGFSVPVALTAGAWTEAVTWTRDDGLQDEKGRLWDVLRMAFGAVLRTMHTVGRARPNTDRITYEVMRVPNTGKGTTARRVMLTAHIGPGDNAEPVFTIMLPNED